MFSDIDWSVKTYLKVINGQTNYEGDVPNFVVNLLITDSRILMTVLWELDNFQSMILDKGFGNMGGGILEVGLSRYLVLLSTDSKTR